MPARLKTRNPLGLHGTSHSLRKAAQVFALLLWGTPVRRTPGDAPGELWGPGRSVIHRVDLLPIHGCSSFNRGGSGCRFLGPAAAARRYGGNRHRGGPIG